MDSSSPSAIVRHRRLSMLSSVFVCQGCTLHPFPPLLLLWIPLHHQQLCATDVSPCCLQFLCARVVPCILFLPFFFYGFLFTISNCAPPTSLHVVCVRVVENNQRYAAIGNVRHGGHTVALCAKIHKISIACQDW